MDVKGVVEELMSHPERYVPVDGTYADGYLDACLDVLMRLGLMQPSASYIALRNQKIRTET
jgi:hypothetical protein